MTTDPLAPVHLRLERSMQMTVAEPAMSLGGAGEPDHAKKSQSRSWDQTILAADVRSRLAQPHPGSAPKLGLCVAVMEAGLR
mmetsp:Transcript_5946/g.19158  ORF Transcript_5946/g.19158 Transcript_5946/m.19158 type:complete len:82 (+) Transcript_5946:270-515(+)